MPQPIEKGFIVDESTDRIISKSKELSAKPGIVSIKLIFKSISGVSVPHLKVQLNGRPVEEYELDSKIPPSTGYYLEAKKMKKKK